ncbi:stabilin-2 [Grus japonensis]|uniref:Stabilin-2 n=1 Tax=Grus japonensis TaxID=30415 RepID=A0ABC9VVZ2_GRUJA
MQQERTLLPGYKWGRNVHLSENAYEWPLSTLGPFTVLVPTNKGLKGTKDLLNNKLKAQYFVKLHVIAGQLNTSTLNNTNIIYTLTGKSGEVSKGEKDNQLRIRIQGGRRKGKLLQGNIIASNGILHIIDKAMDNVEPTFESSKEGSWKLLELVRYHIVSNAELEVASLVSIEHIRSMAKQFIYFNRTCTGQVLVSGEEIEETDIVAKNGRIYTLAGVLIPPTIVPILPHRCDETRSQVAMATCQFESSHGWECVCPKGYEGDGRICYGNAADNLTLEGAHIVAGDIASTNGIIHVIDKVLTPLRSTVMPRLLVRLEQMPDYSIFRGYIIQYSLAKEIEAANTYTIFAPSNDAIENYLRDKKSATLDEGQIRYHVVLDEKLLKNNLHNGMHRETMLGFSYQVGFFLHNGQLFINDAPISYTNVATDKGIIHGLGKVLEIQKNRCDINDTMITAGDKYCVLSENNMTTYTIQIGCQPKCAKTVITRECCAGFFGQQCQPCPGKAGNACFGNGICLDGINGTGTCECGEGFVGTACESCIEGKYGHNCDQACACVHGKCSSGIDGDGSCECDVGWRGVTCETAIDACKTSNGGCSAKAECRRTTPGNRACVCNAGYTGDGIVCIEINPCLENNGGCDRNAECTQTGPNQVKYWIAKGVMPQVLRYHMVGCASLLYNDLTAITNVTSLQGDPIHIGYSQKNNLLGLINDPIHKPVTLFWPTDTAIRGLPQEQRDFLFKKSNTDKLVQYLKFHIVRDAAVLAYQLPHSTSLKTLQGSNLSVSCGDNGKIGALFLNDRQCKIVQRQLEFDGGIAYGIDCLLTDPSLGGRCDSFFTMDFMDKRQCKCKNNYIGDGLNCSVMQLPLDRCLQDNGQCHPDADCADLHFQDTTVGVFHLRSPQGQYKMTYEKAKEACANESATIATYNQLLYAQKARYHLCAAGWLDGERVGYPTAFSSPNCGSGYVGIVDYGRRVNLSETWDVFCYREKEVNCTCKPGYVGDGFSCSGNLLQVLMSFPTLTNFLSDIMAYSNSSRKGREFLRYLTDLSVHATLFAPNDSGLRENETLSGRDIEYHLSNASIMFYEDLTNGTTLLTRLGEKLLVTNTRGQEHQASPTEQSEIRYVDQSAIVEWDIIASNGIIHVISEPLKAPPTPDSDDQQLMMSGPHDQN